MRWIVVFLFLYFIPLIVLFKNYNNIKRSFIYASMYITLVTTIVITNIYISGLNKIKEAMYYQNYSFGKEYTEEKNINEHNNGKSSIIGLIIVCVILFASIAFAAFFVRSKKAKISFFMSLLIIMGIAVKSNCLEFI